MVADSRTAPGGPGGLARPGGRRGPGGVLTVPLGQLGLSEEQRDAVRGVLEEGREALREAGEQARASRQALRDAVGTGGDVDEDAIRAAAAGLGTAQGAMALARASARARIWEVLTPDQRTAADVLRGRPGSSGWKRGASASRSAANAGRSAATSAKGAGDGGRDAGDAGGISSPEPTPAAFGLRTAQSLRGLRHCRLSGGSWAAPRSLARAGPGPPSSASTPAAPPRPSPRPRWW